MIKKLLLQNMSKVNCCDKIIKVNIYTDRYLQTDIYMKKYTHNNLQKEIYTQKFTKKIKTELYKSL